MNIRIRFFVPAIASLLVVAGPALAARVSGTTLTGQVTAVAGGQSVTINGRTYQIAPGSPAASAQVQPGENVDVKLDGPASSPDSHIVTISPHQGS